ncbi:hypothetical protein IWQ54_006473 [Labrenzia sp. EL_195]|nr:hypothetical protein [Labrenzia sp. EL_195]
MRKFKDIDEVSEWLEPMDYEGFWYAVAPYDLVLQAREHCDRQIREEGVSRDVVLDVLKYFARMELTAKFGLSDRMPTPWLKPVETH